MSNPSFKANFNRDALEDLLKRRFFYAPAFSIYGGVKGLYDYGPPGAAIKGNLQALWKKHFIVYDNMLEVDCTALTPYDVLEASGHTAKFCDLLVTDVTTGTPHRADHLLQDKLDQLLLDPKLPEDKRKEIQTDYNRADEMSGAEMDAALIKYAIKAPETGADLSPTVEFNLMFPTSIGPTGALKGFLRPETAQGIFVNFKKLLDFNGGKLPFAAAQVGNSYRNEISPRSGLLRVREFTMGEIEHFCKETEKVHPKFHTVANLVVTFFSSKAQLAAEPPTRLSIGEAVASRLVDNELLAYYLGRTYLFLTAAGANPDYIRFRQHLPNEMAHYAQDCWDAEIETSYGWVECVGHADRSAYDLSTHAKRTGEKLSVWEDFPQKKEMEVLDFKVNKGLIGKSLGGEAKAVFAYLENLSDSDKEALAASADSEGSVVINGHKLTSAMLSFARVKKSVSGFPFTPHVIEPSFGIGRILYSILEHSYRARDGDEKRGYLALPAIIAPIKVSILPLTTADALQPLCNEISEILSEAGIAAKLDATGQTIGRRYARTDEIGIPFGITVDFEGLEKRTVTMRERDTTSQVRVPVADLANLLTALCRANAKWADLTAQYPAQETKADE